MGTEPAGGAPIALDLLVVGGLTVDRFADGSTAPGGSVLHATRAAGAAGLAVGAVTVAGDEPEARRGIAELATLGPVHCAAGSSSIVYRHEESDAGRRLYLEAAASPLVAPPWSVAPRAVLYAPVAAELGPELGGQPYAGALRAAILQGWLRSLVPGRRVEALPLAALSDALVSQLGGCDLLVASREDLIAEAPGAGGQLAALRARFGARPILVVTEGPDGALVSAPGERLRRVPAPYRVRHVPTVGAGDAFAAIMAARLAGDLGVVAAATTAAEIAASMLAARRRGD